MACSDVLAEFLHVADHETSGTELAIEPQVLVETPHPDGVLQRFAFAVQLRGIRCARDRHHVDVDIGGPRSIQPDLFLTKMPALVERAEVEKIEHEWFLDLVRVVARQNDPGDVSLHEFDVVGRMRKCLRPQQRFDQAGIRAVKCAVWHCPLPTG